MTRIQETFAAAGILATLVACGAALSDADHVELARDGVRIGVCKSIASDCGEKAGAPAKPAPQCWAVFDACLLDAGIVVTNPKDGGR